MLRLVRAAAGALLPEAHGPRDGGAPLGHSSQKGPRGLRRGAWYASLPWWRVGLGRR
jgi:hypothetical protein